MKKFNKRPCVYCGERYKGSVRSHKFRFCPNYPSVPRENCLYCKKKVGNNNVEHVLRECSQVPPEVRRHAQIDFIGAQNLRSQRVEIRDRVWENRTYKGPTSVHLVGFSPKSSK